MNALDSNFYCIVSFRRQYDLSTISKTHFLTKLLTFWLADGFTCAGGNSLGPAVVEIFPM